MRIVACGLIAVTALLCPAPVAVAGELADAGTVPQAEMSVLALSLTAGGAVATVASGVALALARRREVGQQAVSPEGVGPASRRSG